MLAKRLNQTEFHDPRPGMHRMDLCPYQVAAMLRHTVSASASGQSFPGLIRHARRSPFGSRYRSSAQPWRGRISITRGEYLPEERSVWWDGVGVHARKCEKPFRRLPSWCRGGGGRGCCRIAGHRFSDGRPLCRCRRAGLLNDALAIGGATGSHCAGRYGDQGYVLHGKGSLFDSKATSRQESGCSNSTTDEEPTDNAGREVKPPSAYGLSRIKTCIEIVGFPIVALWAILRFSTEDVRPASVGSGDLKDRSTRPNRLLKSRSSHDEEKQTNWRRHKLEPIVRRVRRRQINVARWHPSKPISTAC